MIQTEVKAIGANEYMVHVTVPQGEYDRIYAEQIQKLSRQAKLPGFRPGKTPRQVVEKQFGPKLHDDTVSELLQTHYVSAIESSGLNPAVQPELDIPEVQPAGSFEFTLKVTTWPQTEAKNLADLSFEQTTVEVGTADIDGVVERLMQSQVSYQDAADAKVEEGDQVHIDFVGSIDGDKFEGGSGEGVALVVGEGRFIPGFEDQLVGAAVGGEVNVEVAFPADYPAAHLAGKAASFATVVKSIGKPEKPADEDALAKLLGFADSVVFRADIEQRLSQEAEHASHEVTREAVFDALLAANEVELPEALIEQDMVETTKRVVENMKRQGVEAQREMFADEAFRQEVRQRSERGLKLSVLLQSLRQKAGIDLTDQEIDDEIDRQSKQYPEEQQVQFKSWIRGQKEQMAALREGLLERKCVAYIASQAKVKSAKKSLSAWQEEQGN